MFIKHAGLFAVALLALTLPAHAYVGPGAGAGALAVVAGIIGGLFMAFFAVIWYPIKRLMKKRRVARQSAGSNGTGLK